MACSHNYFYLFICYFFSSSLFWRLYKRKAKEDVHNLSSKDLSSIKNRPNNHYDPEEQILQTSKQEILEKIKGHVRSRDVRQLLKLLDKLNFTKPRIQIWVSFIPKMAAAAAGFIIIVVVLIMKATGNIGYSLNATTEPITFSVTPVSSHRPYQTPDQESTEQQWRSRRGGEYTSSGHPSGDGTTPIVSTFSSSTSENGTVSVSVTPPSVDVKYLPGNVSRLIVPIIPTVPSPTHPPEVAESCAIGSCSYDEFRLPVPRNVHSCTSIVSIPISPSGRNSSKMNYIKCDTDCGYYSVNLKDFSYSILFEEKIPEVGTMTIDTTWSHYCDEVEIPTSSYNTSFPALKWLELKVPYECSEVYKSVSTFNTSLDLLSFQRPFVSTRNHHYIKKILRSNSKIRTLIMTNVTFCTHCDIFGGIYFENLEVVELHFGNQTNWDRAIAQLEILISNCPKLKKITTNIKISVSTLETISKHPNNLERARIFVTVDFNNGNPYFSLESLTGFKNLKTLNLYINTVTNASLNNAPSTSIKIIDFEKLSSSSIKRLFIKSSHRLVFDNKAEKVCSLEFGRNKYSLTCKRG